MAFVLCALGGTAGLEWLSTASCSEAESQHQKRCSSGQLQRCLPEQLVL